MGDAIIQGAPFDLIHAAVAARGVDINDEYYYDFPDINGTCVILARTFPEDGSIAYASDDKHGLVDAQGQVLLQPIYDDIGLFAEGLAVIVKDGKAGYINQKGKIVLSMIYEDAKAFSEGLAAVKRDGNGATLICAETGLFSPNSTLWPSFVRDLRLFAPRTTQENTELLTVAGS